MFLCETEVKLWMQCVTLQQGAMVEASPVHPSWPTRHMHKGVLDELGWSLFCGDSYTPHLQSAIFLRIPEQSNI